MSTPRLSPTCEQPCSPSRGLSSSETFQMVALTSTQFTQEILPILQKGYLDSSSGSYFQYDQVTLVNNTKLQDQFNGYRLDLEGKGYSEEELAESFAFLLFETEDQAKAVCQKGLKVGSSNITNLGDPLKGVYLCKYSDFLQPTPWYHGKCGYIIIFKIMKGKVKSVVENYTADLTEPSAGYNCHISINSDTVSSITSHFQAFELTQYYLYDFGQCDALQYPRQIYPFAVVEFQYCDNKCMMASSTETEIHDPEIQAEYHPWKGHLINNSKVISVALRSIGSPLMPVILPAKLEIEYVMHIGELKRKLPQAVFERESYKLKEVCLEGLYCSWFELVECVEGTGDPHLGPLIEEMKQKDLAIVKCLDDQGLLLLFNASVSCFSGGISQTAHNALQAVFVFKAARISHLTGMNRPPRTLSQNRITPLLPGISYAVMQGLKSAGAQAIPRNKLVEDHLIEYFKMSPQHSMSSKDVTTDSSPPNIAGVLSDEGEPSTPGDCQATRISQLSHYFADPASYTLPISTVLKLRGKSLSLCQSSDATHKALCHSRVSEARPLDPAAPQHKRVSRFRKLEGKNTGSPSPSAVSTPPQSGTKSRSATKTAGRANAIGKLIAGKAKSKGSNKTKRKAAKSLPTSLSNKLDAKAEVVGALESSSGAAHSNVSSATSAILGYSTRSQSARGNKRTLAQSGKDVSTEAPTPPVVNRKKPKAAGEPPRTGLKRTSAARKTVGNCRGTRKTGLEKLSREHVKAVCVTGVNTEQVSRYGVCTWNIVEKASENESASLQPLPLSDGSTTLCEKTTAEVASQALQEGVVTNEGETDALNILADLAINAAITAVLKSKRQCILTLQPASEMSVPDMAESAGSDGQLNHCSNLLDSDCLPNAELRGQNITPFSAESLQDTSGGSSENQPSHSAASSGSECPSGVAPAFSSCANSQVHSSQARVGKELSRRSSAVSRISHPLGDHSYSRPPKERESLSLAITNPVPSEKELVVCQNTSLHTESEKRFSGQDSRNVTHTWLSQSEVSSKDEERGYEERTLVGRVLPFRREDTCWENVTNSSPNPQKNNGALGKHGQIADYSSADSAQSKFDKEFQRSRIVHEEKDTVKVTFEWKGPYLFQWDSKYTNDSLEKSVNRALHGPWDPTIQETMKEVKLILHMWIGLFYTKSSRMLQTSLRQVQEHYGTPEPAAADSYEESAGVGEPAFSESGSESVASEKQQTTGVIVSSVIKRIEKKSNLVTSCDSDALFYRETPSNASSQPEEHCLQGSEGDINLDNTQGSEAQSGLAHVAHIFRGEDCEQESRNDLRATGLEQENQESNISQKLTPTSDERNMNDLIQHGGAQDTITGFLAESDFVDASQADGRETTSVIKQTENTQQLMPDEPEVMESQNPSVWPSTCPISAVEKPRGVDDPVSEGGQLGIIRQSSVIKEMFGIQLPAEELSRTGESMSRSNMNASGSCSKPNESSGNRLHTKWFDNLAASKKHSGNTVRAKDWGTSKDTPPTERDVSQDNFGGVGQSDATLQSFPSTNDAPNLHNTIETSEPSNVIMQNRSRILSSSSSLDSSAGPSVIGNTCSYVESCTNVQQLKDGTETQRKRISVGRLQGEGKIASYYDPDCPGSWKRLSPVNKCRSQVKSQATSVRFSVGTLNAQGKQKELEIMNQHNDTASEQSDCGCTIPKESAFTFRNFSEGSEIEIQSGARDFSQSKMAPRISLHASCQKQKRKRKVSREKLQCFPETDSEHGDVREQWNTRCGRLQMRNVFGESNMAEEMSDSDVPVPPVINIPDPLGKSKIYQNFTITAEMHQKPNRQFACKRITRTFCNWQKESNTSQLLGQWDSNARCWSNISPIEKILNLEYIYFSQHLNSMVNRACTSPCASLFSSSSDRNKTARRRKRNIQTVSSGRLIGRKDPLTVTISCRKGDQTSGRRLCNKTQVPHWTKVEDGSWQQEDVALYKHKTSTSFTNNRKRPCSQTHTVSRKSIGPADRMTSKPRPIGEKRSLFADELFIIKRKGCKELQADGRKRIDPFLCLITELCSDLPQNLNEVVKESWKGTYQFYVNETNSDPFFKEIKECLRNEGHVEIGPSDLSMLQPHHSGKVLVIIRNEDISKHLHQIPHLVALKQMPCVQFVGVDNPEDIKDQTFQELFSSGGFVVSDGTVLDYMTLEHLEQISAILEQLSAERKWKWMIHFKEFKRLKEMARGDSVAKRKISLLTQKIAANILEVLPFHECDSKAQKKPDYLSCLLKLQSQKISCRFAVFLTGNPENREVFAQSGILVTDLNSFTKGLRMLTTPSQSTSAAKNAFLTEVSHSSSTQSESPFGKNTATQMPPTLF